MLRNCYPIVMSFMVDYPEACLLCLLHANYACPVCMASKEHFSSLDKRFPARTVSKMKKIVSAVSSHILQGEKEIANKILRDSGIRGQTVCLHAMTSEFLDGNISSHK